MGSQASASKKGKNASETGSAPPADDLIEWSEVSKTRAGIGSRNGNSKISLSGHKGKHIEINVGCVVQGFKKDQDRFVYIPHLLNNPTVFFGGIFDGHGRDGDMVAEGVASKLPRIIRECLVAHLKTISESKGKEVLDPAVVASCFSKSFAEIQEGLDKEFETDVLIPTQKLKEEIESQQKISMGELTVPLGSGTTATTFLIDSKTLFVAYVGDSRAILCKKSSHGEIEVIVLTTDHNISAGDPAELKRVEDSGGTVFGKHVAGDFIDGMLQLTRSLGDVPLHRKNIVSHEPVVTANPLDKSVLFVLGASDGLWDNFTNVEAAKFVHERVCNVAKENASVGFDEVLAKVARELEDESANRASSKGHGTDDTTVMLLAFNKW